MLRHPVWETLPLSLVFWQGLNQDSGSQQDLEVSLDSFKNHVSTSQEILILILIGLDSRNPQAWGRLHLVLTEGQKIELEMIKIEDWN